METQNSRFSSIITFTFLLKRTQVFYQLTLNMSPNHDSSAPPSLILRSLFLRWAFPLRSCSSASGQAVLAFYPLDWIKYSFTKTWCSLCQSTDAAGPNAQHACRFFAALLWPTCYRSHTSTWTDFWHAVRWSGFHWRTILGIWQKCNCCISFVELNYNRLPY